eukprot:m.114974 g.114974  ORF g.114974 m.114974 type:complete len:304 (-) comp9285_c0_seq2:1433-2344(-)
MGRDEKRNALLSILYGNNRISRSNEKKEAGSNDANNTKTGPSCDVRKSLRRLSFDSGDTIDECFGNNEYYIQQRKKKIENRSVWPIISLRDYVFFNLEYYAIHGVLFSSTPLHNQQELEKLRVFDDNTVDSQMLPQNIEEEIQSLFRSEGCSKVGAFLSLLDSMSMHHLQFFCGIQFTIGTIPVIPPLLSQLCASFRKLHSSKSKLTVGARALLKHCHRDTSAKFWGTPTGSDDDKNQAADLVLLKLLQDCAWINVHVLPHDIKVVELRTSFGYGARWLADGSAFRGFLEPQSENGHERGWKH